MSVTTHDKDIRPRLHEHLRLLHPGAAIFDEVGLEYGRVLVDVAVVGDKLRGYEIKSDTDTFKRLPGQVAGYGLTLDEVVIVVGNVHENKVVAAVPEWWGIWSAFDFKQLRAPLPNPALNLLAQSKLLWREEATKLVSKHKVGKGMCVSRLRKNEVLKLLVERVAAADLSADIRGAIRSRASWKPNRGIVLP